MHTILTGLFLRQILPWKIRMFRKKKKVHEQEVLTTIWQ